MSIVVSRAKGQCKEGWREEGPKRGRPLPTHTQRGHPFVSIACDHHITDPPPPPPTPLDSDNTDLTYRETLCVKGRALFSKERRGDKEREREREHQPTMSLAVALGVLAYAASAACLAELLAHFMVYSKPEFKRLLRTYQVEAAKHRKASQQAGAAGAAAAASGGSTSVASRHQKRAEQAAQQAATELASARARANMSGMFVMIPAFMLMGRIFGPAVVLGRLPFSPPSFLQGVTHRGLLGDDAREFGAAFLYAVALNGVRVNLTKLFGSGPGRSESAFAAAGQQAKWTQATTAAPQRRVMRR
jgi:calcium load-activated calcium channel